MMAHPGANLTQSISKPLLLVPALTPISLAG